MPDLRPVDLGDPPDQPPNIFAAGRPVLAAAPSDDSAQPRGDRASAGLFGGAATAPALAQPTLALGRGRHRRWPRPGRRLMVAASALVLGALGCAAALNEQSRPDRRGSADRDANVQSAAPAPAAPRPGSPNASNRDSAAAQPRRLSTPKQTSTSRPETVRRDKPRQPRPARRFRDDAAPALPAPPPEPVPAAAPAPLAPASPPPPPVAREPAPRPAGPKPLPVAPGSPPEFM